MQDKCSTTYVLHPIPKIQLFRRNHSGFLRFLIILNTGSCTFTFHSTLYLSPPSLYSLLPACYFQKFPVYASIFKCVLGFILMGLFYIHSILVLPPSCYMLEISHQTTSVSLASISFFS
jgi:hypothetical protein